jgi:hypothetical protein
MNHEGLTRYDATGFSSSTVPVPPSNRIRSPVRNSRLPSRVLTTHGMPNSRATTAAWLNAPPISILRETDQSHSSKGINAMTTAHDIDWPQVLAYEPTRRNGSPRMASGKSRATLVPVLSRNGEVEHFMTLPHGRIAATQ